MSKIFIPIVLFSSFLLAQTSPATKSAMQDGQIAKVLITINEGELEAAKWAVEHADHKEVKKFAKDMKSGHQDNLKKTQALAKKTKMTLEESDLSKTLREEAASSNANLKTQKKGALDKAYIDQQITMHTNALAHLNNTLIPGAAHADLRAHLEKTRDEVSAHLSHVQELKTKTQ